MARRARRRSQEQELLNNHMDGQDQEQGQDRRNNVSLADLMTALAAMTQMNLGQRRQVKSPSYDGIGCVELFIQGFQEVAVENQWTDQERLIHLRGNLTGKARDCGKGDNVETLFGNLRTVFGLNLKQARDGLDEIRKKTTQSFYEYGQEISRYVEIGYPNMARVDQDDLALEKFMRNSNNLELRKHLLTRNPTNISDAVAMSDIFVRLDKEAKPRVSAMSEEQNMLVETLKMMQTTLAEIQKSKVQEEENFHTPSHPPFMMPEQLRMYTPSYPGPNYPDPRMYTPSYPEQMNTDFQTRRSAPKPLQCFQCGGPHMKRNCPQLTQGTQSLGKSQNTRKTQQTLNSQGPTQ